MFDMLGFQHLEKRVSEKEAVLTVIEAPAHFVKVGAGALQKHDATFQFAYT